MINRTQDLIVHSVFYSIVYAHMHVFVIHNLLKYNIIHTLIFNFRINKVEPTIKSFSSGNNTLFQCAPMSNYDNTYPLQCPVCRNFLVDPCTLQCGHTTCQLCLARMWGHKDTLCPLCKEPWQVLPAVAVDLRSLKLIINVDTVAILLYVCIMILFIYVQR